VDLTGSVVSFNSSSFGIDAVCPSLPVHLVLAPVFGGVRVTHLLLVLCVFSFISYVLLVVLVDAFRSGWRVTTDQREIDNTE
jgi:hypothetical protein